jgi:hypothetical protein
MILMKGNPSGYETRTKLVAHFADGILTVSAKQGLLESVKQHLDIIDAINYDDDGVKEGLCIQD